MRNTFVYSFVFALLLLYPSLPQSPRADTSILKLNLGGKGVSGPYFPTVKSIADLVNQNHTRHGVRLTIRSSRSSVSIINTVLTGKLELGVARRDHIYQASRGLAQWAGRPQTELRSVLNVQAERVALVAFVKSGIRSILDLKGRRIFIGGPNSDLRPAAIDVLAASGIDPDLDITLKGSVIDEAPGMMKENEIDAFFYVMGSMNRDFIDLVYGAGKLYLVPITGPGIDRLLAANPFYQKLMISIQHHPYFANKTDTQVLGVKTGLITTTRTAEKTTYLLTREIIGYIKQKKIQNATGEILSLREMTTGMAAPIHPGATRYYQQAGIDYSAAIP